MDPCKNDNELFGSVTGIEFPDLISEYQLIEKDSAPLTYKLWLEILKYYFILLSVRSAVPIHSKYEL
jgi:hypothetical protein